MRGFSVVMTNWNGMEYLPRVLPSVEESVARVDDASEVIIVDDGSTDGSKEYIRDSFPGFELIETPRNLGFQGASNLGFRRARYHVVVSLNNDIILDPATFPRLFPHFEDGSVFAVSTKVLLWDGETYLAGRRAGEIWKGHLRLLDAEAPETAAPSLFATGGAAAFRRSFIERLGGFDTIFHPLYWEDIDLCYRAWKRGWKTIYDPSIIMLHKHRATIERQYGGDALSLVTARNAYLFTWKNWTDEDLRREALRSAPREALRSVLSGRIRFVRAYIMAMMRRGEAMESYHREKVEAVWTDARVLAEVNRGFPGSITGKDEELREAI